MGIFIGRFFVWRVAKFYELESNLRKKKIDFWVDVKDIVVANASFFLWPFLRSRVLRHVSVVFFF